VQGAAAAAETSSQPGEATAEPSGEYLDEVSVIDAEVLMRHERGILPEVLLGACTLRASDKESVALEVDMVSALGGSDDVDTVPPGEADMQDVTHADATLPPLDPSVAFLGYFEPQELALCGMHALNNALGLPLLTRDVMTVACTEYLSESAAEGNPEVRNLHESLRSGWYAEAVMAFALRWRDNIFSFDLDSPILANDDASLLRLFAENTAGIAVNENGQHWSCFKVYDERIWFLDSLREPLHVSFDFYVAYVHRYQRAHAVRTLG
jgi:hypothetical protein